MQDAILGVDASLCHTGISVVSLDDEWKASAHIERTCVPKTMGVQRLIYIEDWFKILMEEINCKLFYSIKYVVMEGYAYTPRFGQAFSLGELGGILKRFFYLQKISLLTVQPQTLKKFLTGIGKGDKNMILLKTFRKYNVEFDSDHVCEAFGLAMIGKAIYDISNNKKDIKQFFEYEQEVIKLIGKQIK